MPLPLKADPTRNHIAIGGNVAGGADRFRVQREVVALIVAVAPSGRVAARWWVSGS
ncbi:hypothetical protein FHW96_000305 [Novosphingobium sp. SG751A]|nr:hypothetical protein [Novosphingobium sp. SG751A]